MFTREFIKATLERALKTFVQALLALFLADQGFDVLAVDWAEALTVAASATVLSVLTSFASSPVGPKGSPSLVEIEPVASDEKEGV